MTSAAFLGQVEAKFRATVAGPAAALGTATQAFALRAGKRVRPRLIHACAEALGLPVQSAVTWAALVELVHVASLIHDDVIDSAQLRRGNPSLRSCQDNRRAVLGGDLLISAAWLTASRELRADLTAVLAQAMIAMTGAEWHERELQWNPNVDLSRYFRVIEGKTAALFAAAAEGTAMIAGVPPRTRRALTRYGRAFGIAFQIADDVGDYERPAESSGKEPLKDLREGIVTLPLLIAMRSGGPCAESVRRYLLSRGQAGLDPRAVEELLAESQALPRSRRVARRQLRQSRADLSDLPGPGVLDLLPGLADASGPLCAIAPGPRATACLSWCSARPAKAST